MKFPKKPYIEATQITLFWSDKPEGEICQHENPEGWDEWLAEIEAERNEEEEEIGRSKRGDQEEWAWVYGDECQFLWEHFGMEVRSSNDRMKIKLVDFEASQEEEGGQ